MDKRWLHIFLLSCFFSYGQTDSTNFYSDIFKDTNFVCGGMRYKAFNYLTSNVKLNKLKNVKKYLGFDVKIEKKNGVVEYLYVLKSDCEKGTNIDWSSVLWVVFEVKRKKVLSINYKNIG